MRSRACNTDSTKPGDEIATTDVFELLRSPRRRYVLHYLSRRGGAVDVRELAERVDRWERDSSDERFARVHTGLVHTHLPKLAAAGVVDYDEEATVVSLLPAANDLAPYLELAADGDLR